MQRSLDCVPWEAYCTKSDTSDVLMCNFPMENKVFIDKYICARRHARDKTQYKFTHGEKVDTRRKIWLHEWWKFPVLRNLNIAEGYPSFKRNIEVKLEDNNKTSKKGKSKNKLV